MVQQEPASAGNEAALGEVCRSVAQLAAEMRTPPSRIAVRAGEIAVELEWPVAPSVPAAPAAEVTVSASVNGAAPAVNGARAEPEALEYIRATVVGTFYRAPGPDAKPFVAEGDLVAAGQQVGILEAMKLMMPVQADRAARVVEVVAADGAIVEYGEPLVAIRLLDESD